MLSESGHTTAQAEGRRRPNRLITWSWILAALSMLASILHTDGRYQVREIRTIGMLLALAGMTSVVVTFAMRGLRTADKWALGFVFIACLLAGTYLLMMGGLVKN